MPQMRDRCKLFVCQTTHQSNLELKSLIRHSHISLTKILTVVVTLSEFLARSFCSHKETIVITFAFLKN